MSSYLRISSKTKRPIHKERWALYKEDCMELLATVKNNSPTDMYPIMFTFLQTGMRKAELITLEWDDLDFANRQIFVRNKPDLIIEGQPHKCKWGSERTLPMGQALATLLQGLYQSRRSRFVFPNQTGGMRWHNWNRHFRNAIRGAKIRRLKDLTAHVLRHTFLSHLLHYAKRDIKEVSKLAGHKNLATTYGYIHLLSDAQGLQQAVDALPDYAGLQTVVPDSAKKNLIHGAEPEMGTTEGPLLMPTDQQVIEL